MSVRGRLVLVATLLVLPVAVGAQSLGEIARKERERREARKKPPAKVLTEADLEKAKGSSLSAQAGDPSNAPAATSAEDAEGADKASEGTPGAAQAGKTEDEIQAEQAAAWKTKIAAAETKLKTYQDAQAKLQTELNSPDLGTYSQGRSTIMELIADAEKNIVAARAEIETLEAEGRAKAYRR